MIDWIIGTFNSPMRDLSFLQVLFLLAVILALIWSVIYSAAWVDRWRKHD